MGNHHEHHDHHGHEEAQQNEIAGPVLFVLVCVIAAVIIIYFWAK